MAEVQDNPEEMSEEEIGEKIEKAMAKAKKESGRVASFFDDLKVLSRMIKAYFYADDFLMPKMTMVAAVGGIVYFLNPIDVIPDAIAGIGFTDDAALLAFILQSFKTDIDAFKKYEEGIKEEPELVEAEIVP